MRETVMQTKYFGELPLAEDARIEFPSGVPGFERYRWFAAIRLPGAAPLVFLQSLEDSNLCFVTLPPANADPGYHLSLSDEDLRRLNLPVSRQPSIGRDVQCLAVLAIREEGATANLLAPIVINPKTMKAVQAVNVGSSYSHQCNLPQGAERCS
jgi:flagellar assembly factor FliW